MGYSPNNPLVPGDPYSYDLRWMVKQIKAWKDPLDSAERAEAAAAAAILADEHSTEIYDELNATRIYITPEMYGAIGDGTADDTAAMNSAVAAAVAENKIIYGKGIYKIAPTQVYQNAVFYNIHFFFESSMTVQSAVVFDYCKIFNCIFESVNDKPSAWTTSNGDFSNIDVSANNCFIFGCKFIALMHLSMGYKNADMTVVQNCIFKDCETGIYGDSVKDVYITNCMFDMLDYVDGLDHTIYVSEDCENWVISNITSKGCPYYPIHTFNSGSGNNPKNITVRDSAFYDFEYAIANNGELNIFNCYFEPNTGANARFLYSDGTTYFDKCSIEITNMLFIDANAGYTTFNNCDIKCTAIIPTYGSAANTIYLNIYNSILNITRIIGSNRNVVIMSKNNIYETYTRLLDNSNSTGLITATFIDDIFKGGDIVYAYSFELTMLNCMIDLASAAGIIASRSTGICTAFLSNLNARVNGTYIVSTGITLSKNNCYNIA